MDIDVQPVRLVRADDFDTKTERSVLSSTIQYAGDSYRLRTYFARHNRTELL
jgi:GntR family transcriptional regulator